MKRITLACIVLVVLIGGCHIAEEGPWTGSISGLVGGPCEDDTYSPGKVLNFTIVETSSDGFELTTDEYAADCSLDKESFTCEPANVQVSGATDDTVILRTFTYSGELSTNDDISGDVAFESTCTGSGCTESTAACRLTWRFSAKESS
jgi:hypothetical protein